MLIVSVLTGMTSSVEGARAVSTVKINGSEFLSNP